MFFVNLLCITPKTVTTMKKNVDSLKSYTLNQLTLNVAMRLDGFNNAFTSETMWKGIIELCKEIEVDVRNTCSVILEAKKDNDLFINGSNIQVHQAKLTRIYILLYYLHRDEEAYKTAVFPLLLTHMGTYANDSSTKVIHYETDKIIKLDTMIQKMEEEKKKNVQPLFAYEAKSGYETDHLCIEYNEEKLFRKMSGIIKRLAKDYGTEQDEAEVWYNAKKIVHTLRDIPRPELMIKRAAIGLVKGQFYNGYEGAQIVLISAYVMIRASKNNAHFSEFIKTMESVNDSIIDLNVINNYIGGIKTWVNENLPIDDYDYIEENDSEVKNFSSADIEQIKKQIIEQERGERDRLQKEVEQREADVKVLKKQVSSLQKELAEKTQKSDEPTEEEQDTSIETPRQKIRIELLNYLFAQLGYDTKWIKENRKTMAMSKIYAAILGLNNPKGIANDVGKVVYSKRPPELDEEVSKTNKLLQAINTDWKIKL